jgi:hypothetical protein
MAVAPFVGIVGYRRSRRNILGMQARMVTLRDGVLRVVDKDDREVERVTVGAAAVELRRGMVQVADGDNAFFLYGTGGHNKVPGELLQLASRQEAELAMAPGEGMFSALDAAAKSRALYDLLREAGARER